MGLNSCVYSSSVILLERFYVFSILADHLSELKCLYLDLRISMNFFNNRGAESN